MNNTCDYMADKLNSLKPKIKNVLKKYNITKAGVFGSYARGDQKKNSDIDILVEFNGSLLRLVAIERELEEELGIKVDLLTYKGVNPHIKNYIFADEVKII